jgi:hypothetical protein
MIQQPRIARQAFEHLLASLAHPLQLSSKFLFRVHWFTLNQSVEDSSMDVEIGRTASDAREIYDHFV